MLTFQLILSRVLFALVNIMLLSCTKDKQMPLDNISFLTNTLNNVGYDLN